MFEEVEFKTKGKYIIWIEDNEDGTSTIYSTDSHFWKSFFSPVKNK